MTWTQCLAVALIALCFEARPVDAQTITLRTSEIHNRDYPTSKALLWMDQRLQALSEGTMRVKLYPGAQLGSERDTLEITIFGGIDLNRVNLAPINSIVPETSVLTMPFLFRSQAHMRAVLDSEIGAEILALLEPHGLVGLAFYDSGARSFYNTVRPIRTPDDLKGMKIRVMNSEIYVEMVAALGANPVPMSFGQVYESLMLGTIDGSENNWPSYETSRHFEVAKYYSRTEHTMAPEVLVMSKRRWEKLTSQQRAWVRQAARESVPVMRQHWDTQVQKSRAAIISADSEVIEVLDQAPFEAAMRPVYDKFLTTPELRDLADRIRNFELSPREFASE